jgi:hypothetical protein
MASGCVNGFGASIFVAEAEPGEGKWEGHDNERGRGGERDSQWRQGGTTTRSDQLGGEGLLSIGG